MWNENDMGGGFITHNLGTGDFNLLFSFKVCVKKGLGGEVYGSYLGKGKAVMSVKGNMKEQ
jgi:hypothetical protein